MDEEYELSDSEDGYSKEDKLFLENARRSLIREDISPYEEVYPFDEYESDDDYKEEDGEEGEEEEEEEEEDGLDMGSDLEDEEKLPDERAWGKRKRSFYNTDFVDQDYEGMYQGEEAEIAELEEQEARAIHKRLTKQLTDMDFSITEFTDIAEASDATGKKEVIQSDLSKLTTRQKLDLLKKESPEFFVLVEDFKDKMTEAQKIYPVIYYYEKHVQKPVPGVKFLQIKMSLILNYCTNISFYLLLKAKRVPVKNHPIMKSLFKYRQLLEQIEKTNKKIEPELEKILELLKAKKELPIEEDLPEKKEKVRLKLLEKHKMQKEKKLPMQKKKIANEDEGSGGDIEMEGVEEEEEEKEKEKEKEKDMRVGESSEKRAITYEMAKNKGLIPRRNKEKRNPRVKHRRKYEKAKIRRRGQVRTPRTEIPVYGGEPTGIKIGLTKSIKLK